ncbi:MAG: DUF1211 domain-containing protein [Solirubrobacterales bacterium]|nr:MAG: DUF1211 domain-containing protein [Solirubrobacterales bacterium]
MSGPEQTETADLSEKTSEDPSRIIALTDGVVAIAITLLVLDIAVPEIPDALVDEELADALWALRPQVFGFVLSFWVVGYFWLGHRVVFSHLRRTDVTLIVINLCFLLMIVFIPFAARLLADYVPNGLAVAVYAGVSGAAGLTLVAMISYPKARGHFELDVSLDHVGVITRRLLVAPIVFIVTIPIAFLSGWLAVALWALIPISRYLMKRRVG